MSNEELQQAVESNIQAIASLNESISFLVTEFIRPSAQQALSNYERLERLERVVEQNAQAITAMTELSQINRQQIAANAEKNAELDLKMDRVTAHQQENDRQITILINEGRADRQAQREALTAIIANSRKIDQLEQQTG